MGLTSATARRHAQRTGDGQRRTDLSVTFTKSEWFVHPDADVAVLPMAGKPASLSRLGTPPLFASFKHEMFPSIEDMQYIEAFEDVIFVGFPQGLWDKTNKTPTVRRGITATAIWQDYMGEPAFLNDGAVFPGNSGGPALIVDRNGFFGPKGFEIGRIRTILLGVVAQSTSIQIGSALQPASIATVVKWTRVLEALSLVEN